MITIQSAPNARFADGLSLPFAQPGFQPKSAETELDGFVWPGAQPAPRIPYDDQRPISILGWGLAVATGLLMWMPIAGAIGSLAN